MNWDAIGAIAELLGAIGVIASLVYLAAQIRKSPAKLLFEYVRAKPRRTRKPPRGSEIQAAFSFDVRVRV